MGELKHLDPAAKSFEANGKMYFIESSFSMDRWRDYQKLEVELSFGMSASQMREGIKEIWTAFNTRDKMADATITAHRLLIGAAAVDDERFVHPIFKMCALFINTKDEDRTRIDQRLVDEKIEDWSREGIAVDGFFRLALSSISGFISAYADATQLGSQKERKEVTSPLTSPVNSA